GQKQTHAVHQRMSALGHLQTRKPRRSCRKAPSAYRTNEFLPERSPLPSDIDCKGSSNSCPHSNGECLFERIERKEPCHNQRNSSDYYEHQARESERSSPFLHRENEQPGHYVKSANSRDKKRGDSAGCSGNAKELMGKASYYLGGSKKKHQNSDHGETARASLRCRFHT